MVEKLYSHFAVRGLKRRVTLFNQEIAHKSPYEHFIVCHYYFCHYDIVSRFLPTYRRKKIISKTADAVTEIILSQTDSLFQYIRVI